MHGLKKIGIKSGVKMDI